MSGEIVQAINTALAGERYGQEAFEQYAEKTSDAELRSLLQEMIASKQRHIQKLEARLSALDEKPSLAANVADKYAKLKTSLQGSDDMDLLRRSLGDIQTGVVDTHNLRVQFTDPVSTAIFTEIEKDLSLYERHVAELYRARMGAGALPAKPTTGAAVSM